MIIELLKSLLFGIVEGITEWLPISSTGHMILLDELVHLSVSADPIFNAEFYSMFEVVIQLGAILAVICLFFRKLNPLDGRKTADEKKGTLSLWLKVIVGVLPSGVIGVLLDDWLDEHLYNYVVVAVALLVYGVAFLAVEGYGKKKNKTPTITDTDGITLRHAILIGAFQCLALIPGTSRSGSTILGAMLLGLSRTAASEFSFFLAIPTMAGASLVRGLKFIKFVVETGAEVPTTAIVCLAVGFLAAFAVSLAAIKFLMDFVRKHTFSSFAIYRIALGIVVLAYFLLR